MNKYGETDRALALAGVVQAAALVQQIARKGMTDSQALEASINSLFETDPPDVESVYGGSHGVSLGLRLLHAQLGKQSAGRDLELTKYVVGIMYLERQFIKRKQMLQKVVEGIERAKEQSQYFSRNHPNVIASLADLYSSTISKLTPRIMVNGEQRHLSNPENATKIRALLLAAIRSTVLWRQCGGGRLNLIFSRRAIVREVESILERQKEPTSWRNQS